MLNGGGGQRWEGSVSTGLALDVCTKPSSVEGHRGDCGMRSGGRGGDGGLGNSIPAPGARRQQAGECRAPLPSPCAPGPAQKSRELQKASPRLPCHLILYNLLCKRQAYIEYLLHTNPGLVLGGAVEQLTREPLTSGTQSSVLS